MAMQLTAEQQAMLNGEQGEVMAKVMKTLVMYGETFGAERMVLISDSLRATGMPDGIYPFGGQEIEVHGNRATIAGHPETLAGSVTSVMGCMRKAVEFGIPLADAVRAASYNPAQAIKIDDRAGSLESGKEASIVLLNKEDLSFKTIIFKGNVLQLKLNNQKYYFQKISSLTLFKN